ncbi:MAG: twin-arginine translocation signal domain-containing protein, partial [Melioribacteraceae bacterium]|nr:twin-arginine translocation signal domain-containing protein [Melioribacteraceae bacterium]
MKKENSDFTRRDFLKTSAVAGTGLMVAPWVKSLGQKSSVSNDINVALI